MAISGIQAPVVTTSSGQVSGSVVDGIASYLGIPYAAPPVGPAAYAAPIPAPSWDGVRDATRYGPTAPQVAYPGPIAALLDNVVALGDDYLNLNIWSPDVGTANLPVMVWIHGGAFTRGSNRIDMYAGDTFARDGVVCVGINYRIGVPGFASVEGAPENRGLLDQIAALQWVRDNIAAFGGDPDDVTIFGESAGAMGVASLLSSPRAAGLFHRAIMQSGNGIAAADVADARKSTARLAELLGVAARADAFAGVPAEAMLRAQSQLGLEMMVQPDPTLWGPSVVEAGLGIMSQFPVIDGDVLTDMPERAIAAGAGSSVPLLAGWNADEFRFFLVAYGGVESVTDEIATAMVRLHPAGPDLIRARIADGASPGEALCEMLTAHAFSVPTTRIATSRTGGSTYLYEFGYQSPQAGIRAGHAVEIPFVFDHLASAASLVGPRPDQHLADAMHQAWVEFATTGDPGWAPHDEAGQVRRFR